MAEAPNYKEFHEAFLAFTKNTCTENRKGLIRMLLSNLSPKGIRDVQNIISRMKTRKKFCTEPTTENLTEEEDAWYELNEAEELTNWAGYSTEHEVVGYIKTILVNYRYQELRQICSSDCYHAREAILYPERAVSRRSSVPARVGWWTAHNPEDIVAVDCEMISKIVGRKSSGKPRCRQSAASVAVVNFNGETIYNKLVKHAPESIYLTPKAKQLTGFTRNTFINGTELTVVQKDLDEIFKGKLLILINAGSDFAALEMDKGAYTVFDLHECYEDEIGKIGLRSLVKFYFDIDIQAGVHSAECDAKYTMKVFREAYIPFKLSKPDEVDLRGTSYLFHEIPRVK